MMRELRLWLISVLLGWVLDLTPKDERSILLLQSIRETARSLRDLI